MKYLDRKSNAFKTGIFSLFIISISSVILLVSARNKKRMEDSTGPVLSIDESTNHKSITKALESFSRPKSAYVNDFKQSIKETKLLMNGDQSDPSISLEIEKSMIKAAIKSYFDAANSPYRDTIRNELLDTYIDEYQGIDVSKKILTDFNYTFETFGDQQAKVRLYSIRVIDRLYARKIISVLDLEGLLAQMSKQLIQSKEWPKSIEVDYGDILWTYMDAIGWKNISSDPMKFRNSISYDKRLESIVRKNLIARFESVVEENEFYPTINAVRDGV